ncbi:hypothetical protein E2C01_045437 [Portunus trituberculatus]|uniref:Uncharacterized protein n=1 Tax=Portunus trituberculatus TaxID=210409 RepID=A0A5B7G373_PORTR|nr:hypothetical protein [Portunus trituberculatus]
MYLSIYYHYCLSIYLIYLFIFFYQWSVTSTSAPEAESGRHRGSCEEAVAGLGKGRHRYACQHKPTLEKESVLLRRKRSLQGMMVFAVRRGGDLDPPVPFVFC